MLKVGKFHCKVVAPVNGWFGEAGENNTPYIRIPLVIDEEGDCEGDDLVFQGWLTDKSFDRTIKNLAEVFDWDGDLDALAKQLKTGHFVGKPCQVVLEEEEYNGKKSIKIKWLNRADGGGKSMESTKAQGFAARFSERAKKAAASAGDAPKPATRPSPFAKPPPKADPHLDVPEDAIPF